MDFQQGPITTIHDYGTDADAAGLLRQGLQQRPTSLLIPCLMEEFSRPALGLIREVLRELDGLQELVIALSAGTAEEVLQAEAFFADMPFPVRVHWTNGPAVKELLASLQEFNLEVMGPLERVGPFGRALALPPAKLKLLACLTPISGRSRLSTPRGCLRPCWTPLKALPTSKPSTAVYHWKPVRCMVARLDCL